MTLFLDKLCHGYGPLQVLREITLGVGEAEIVAILGPSGCGKSTLLRLAGGMEAPGAGSVTTAKGPAGSTSIAYVFQDPTLLPWRTVAENVGLPLEHRPMAPSERRRRVAEALRRVELADFAAAFPKTLSGGMRQRVSLARALASEPQILLMDEPLASLDAETSERLLVDLVRLWTETRFSCLYVTHSPAEAVRIGHRVVVLSSRPGRIIGTVPVEVPLAERHEQHPRLAFFRERIRALLRGPQALPLADAG